MAAQGPGVSPYDTHLSSGTRFLIELAAWVAAPWAAAELWGGWAAVPTLIVLLALPSLFNTPGDKNQTSGFATPGPIRILIEMVLLTGSYRTPHANRPAGEFPSGPSLDDSLARQC